MTDMFQLISDKYEYEAAYLKRWTDAEIDALIMPTTPWVGYKPWTWVKSHQYVGYSSIWNFVNYAALTIPTINANATKDQPDEDLINHVPRNPSDDFNHKQCGFI